MCALTVEEVKALYGQFKAPIAELDCGRRCAPYNESGKPFCCDIRHAVPSAYQGEWAYLKENTDLWEPWEGEDEAETRELKAKTPEGQVLIACLGPERCQRDFRALTCRSFPFYPYINAEGQFTGMSYYAEYETRCWVISNLQIVSPKYRAEFIRAYDRLFELMPEEHETFAYHSTMVREEYARRRRTIPLLHRDGGTYKISPGSGKMRPVEASHLPKFGPYKIADLLPFPGE